MKITPRNRAIYHTIRRVIAETGHAPTRAELARMTNYHMTTVNLAIHDLRAGGYLEDNAQARRNLVLTEKVLDE